MTWQSSLDSQRLEGFDLKRKLEEAEMELRAKKDIEQRLQRIEQAADNNSNGNSSNGNGSSAVGSGPRPEDTQKISDLEKKLAEMEAANQISNLANQTLRDQVASHALSSDTSTLQSNLRQVAPWVNEAIEEKFRIADQTYGDNDGTRRLYPPLTPPPP